MGGVRPATKEKQKEMWGKKDRKETEDGLQE